MTKMILFKIILEWGEVGNLTITPFLLHRVVLCSVSRLKESQGIGIKFRNKIREEQVTGKKSSELCGKVRKLLL